MTDEKKRIPKELKELVLWKLETEIPARLKLSLGNKGAFSKDELREHVEKEDEIGRIFIEMQLSFMKDLMSGEVAEALAR